MSASLGLASSLSITALSIIVGNKLYYEPDKAERSNFF